MISFRYDNPWNACWSADTDSEVKWLKRQFTFTDTSDTRHKQQFGYFPKVEYLDDVHHRMTHGQVIAAMVAAQGDGLATQMINAPQRLTFETGPIPADYLPGITMRRYQRMGIQVLAGYGQGIAVAGTGAGKTVMMGGLLKAILEFLPQITGVLVMIYSKDLLNQTAKRFIHYGVPAEDIGIVHSDISPQKQVLEAQKKVVLSTHRSIEKFPGTLDRTQYVICDEAHGVVGPMWTAIFNHLPNMLNVVGFTATPWDTEDERQKMLAIFGQVLFDIPMRYLVQNGWLMSPEIRMVNLSYKDRDIAACKAMGWQQAKKVFCLEDQNRNLLPVVILRLIRGRALVIYDELKHGKHLQELYEKQGIPTMLAEGSSSKKKRQECLDWFAPELEPDEPGKVLLASRIFNEGVDLDNGTNHLFIMGPKAKRRIAVQRLGRALRICSEGWVMAWDSWDGNHPTIARWSGGRKKTWEDLGFRVTRIEPDHLPQVAEKHPTTRTECFRYPVAAE